MQVGRGKCDHLRRSRASKPAQNLRWIGDIAVYEYVNKEVAYGQFREGSSWKAMCRKNCSVFESCLGISMHERAQTHDCRSCRFHCRHVTN